MLFHLISFFLIILASSAFLADIPVFDLKHNSFYIIQVISLFLLFSPLQTQYHLLMQVFPRHHRQQA